MRTIRVFVSSPGDVQKERKLADNLIRAIAAEIGVLVSVSYSNLLRSDETATEPVEGEDDTLVLCPFFWEYQRFSPDQGYQEQTPNTAEFDLVICILRSRLGTELAPKFTLPDGSRPKSGTDYEIGWALHQSQKTHGIPALHVYRNRTTPNFPLEPEDQYQELVDQWKSLKGFFARWERDSEGHFIAAFNNYRTLDEFEELFRLHFRDYLISRLDVGSAHRALVRKPKRWEDNPFRGLEVFEFEHASIFHGRTKAVGEVLDLVSQLANTGIVFVLILGPSGSGKSSLVRAGVLAILTEPGAIEGIGVWRRAVTKPAAAGAAADPFDALAAALLAPAALPELADREATNPINEFAQELRENPAAVVSRVKDALRTAALLWKNNHEQMLRDREEEMLAAGRADDAELARQQREHLTEPRTRLVLVVDQLEELFTTGFSTEIQRRYAAAITGLARGGRVYVIATLRNDFYARFQEFTELVELAKHGRFDLRPAAPNEIATLIRRPAEAASLVFEKDPETGQELDDALRDAAAKNPESLPLLEHALARLFQAQAQRNDGILRWSDYRAMGGLEGALATHAEAVFEQLRPHEQAAFDLVMRRLVTLGQGQEEVPNRRTAPYFEICDDGKQSDEKSGARSFVDLFVTNRLFVADSDPHGNVVISVAHEALLQEWQRVKSWVAANRDFLRMRNRLDASLQNWKERGGHEADLLPAGLPLAEGEKLRSEFGSSLTPEQIDYIQASIGEQHRQQHRRARIRNRVLAAVSAMALIAGILALVAGFQWIQAETARKNAEDQRRRAEDAVASQKKQLEQASWSSFNEADRKIKRGEWEEGIADLGRAIQFNPENRIATERFFQQLILGRWRVRTPLATFHHEAQVKIVVFSPDSTRILTAGDDNVVRLWDATTGKLSGAFHHDGKVYMALFSPDGTRILTSSEDKTAKLWDAATNQGLAVFHHDDKVYTAVFSPHGARILTGSGDRTAKLWDSATGQELTAFHHDGAVLSAVFSPDGAKVLTASGDKTAKLWDPTTGQELATFRDEDVVLSAVFSPDGARVLTGGYSKTAKLWDAITGNLLGTFRHDDWVETAVFSPGGSRILTRSWATARLWDAVTGKQVENFGRDESVTTAVFSPDGARILTGGGDKTARLWDAVVGRELAVFHHDGPVTGAVFSPDATRIVTASDDKTAKLWDAASGGAVVAFDDNCKAERGFHPIKSAVFSPVGTRILTSDSDRTIRIWDANSGQLLAAIHHDDEIASVVFDPGGAWILTASADKTAKLWDAVTGKELTTFHHDGVVFSALFSPDRARVLTASADKTAKLWDAVTGKELATFHDDDEVYSAVFSLDGTRIVTASKDKTAKLWDIASGDNLATFRHDGVVTNAVFSSDGARILITGENHVTKLWDAVTGNEVATFHHEDGLSSAMFSPDGARILTTSWATARLWDAKTGKHLAALPHGSIIDAVFSPKGDRILTASKGETAKLWNAATGNELATLDYKDHADNLLANVLGAVFSPDGTRILTASWRTTRLWDATTGKELAAYKDGPQVATAIFSADGARVLIASEDNTAKLWDVATARALASLVSETEERFSNQGRDRVSNLVLDQIRLVSEFASGRQIAEDGSLTVLPSDRALQLEEQLLASAKDDQLMSRFIRWFCDRWEETTIFPDSALSIATWVDNHILTLPPLNYTLAIEDFAALPGRPLPEIAMAQFVEPVWAKFLRAEALQRLPADSRICIRAGALLHDQGQPAQALIAADKGLAADASSLAARRLRAVCLDELKRWEEALAEYQAIVARSDALGFDFGQTAYLAARMGKGDLCDSVSAQAILRFPNDSDLYYYRGWSLLNLHRAGEAVTAFEKTENLLGNRKPWTFLLAGEAAANWAAGATDKAVATYVKLVNIDKNWVDSYQVRQLKWVEAESQPLLDALAETLRQHPELKPR